jgi:hypothetical protein
VSPSHEGRRLRGDVRRYRNGRRESWSAGRERSYRDMRHRTALLAPSLVADGDVARAVPATRDVALEGWAADRVALAWCWGANPQQTFATGDLCLTLVGGAGEAPRSRSRSLSVSASASLIRKPARHITTISPRIADLAPDRRPGA